MSRDKTAIATLVDDGQKISIGNTVGGYHPDYPERCAMAQDDDANTLLSSPTFAGDASKLFWAENTTGIHMATLPKFTAKGVCPQFTDGGRVIVAGASNPDWGPADVPAARPTPRDPGTKPGPSIPTPNDPGTTPGATAKLSVTKVKLAAALKRGLTLKFTGAKDGKHTVSAKFGKTTVAKGSVTVKSGAGKVTLKFTAAGKQKLKGKKTAKLAISGAGASLSYTLRR